MKKGNFFFLFFFNEIPCEHSQPQPIHDSCSCVHTGQHSVRVHGVQKTRFVLSDATVLVCNLVEEEEEERASERASESERERERERGREGGREGGREEREREMRGER